MGRGRTSGSRRRDDFPVRGLLPVRQMAATNIKRKYMECLNKIYAGDCLELMKSLPSGSIDLIIADPPYCRTNGKFDYVFKSEHDYIEWMHRWISVASVKRHWE